MYSDFTNSKHNNSIQSAKHLSSLCQLTTLPYFTSKFMLGGTTTGTTATGTMTNLLAPLQEHNQLNINNNDDSMDNDSTTSLLSVDEQFNESQCLICNESSSDLDQNLTHMSKVHGLHIETSNLLVDIESLLAYFHLVIAGYYECLFCGKQRSTRQAAQQHMIAKGHCKYDLTNKDAEIREFYDFSSLEAEEELNRNVLAMRLSDNSQLASHARLKKGRQSSRADTHGRIAASTVPQAPSSPTSQSQSDTDPDSVDAEISGDSLTQLSARAQKKESTLNNQLARLRADDRQSLLHLPISQQRALLLTHHKQMEKARRTEQTQRGNLESAGNSFARLGTIRLIRKPPHTGRVQTLKR